MLLALTDNATAILLAIIGLVGVIVPVSITAWVALKLRAIAPLVEHNSVVVARMAPAVEQVVAEVVEPRDSATINLATKVTAIDASVNNRQPQDRTLRQTAEATGQAVTRIEVEQQRLEKQERGAAGAAAALDPDETPSG